MANRFTGMMQGLDPQTARLVAAISGSPQNRSVSIQGNEPRLSQTVEADRLARAQQQADSTQQSLSNVPKGLRQAAPLVGVINSIAAQMQRKNDNRTIEELYGNVQAQEAQARARAQQEKQAAAEAAQQQAKLAREQELADSAVKRAHDMRLKQFDVDNRAVAPQEESERDVLARIRQLPPEQQAEALALELPQVAKYEQRLAEGEDKQAAQSDIAQQQAAFKQGIQDDIRWLLDPSRDKALRNATGAFQGSDMYPTSLLAGQDSIDWQNRFSALEGKLTQENLSLLKGAMSEKELDFLRSLSTGGVNLQSGQEQIKQGLGAFLDGGGLPQGVTEDDIQTTMQKHGMTRDQVVSKLTGG